MKSQRGLTLIELLIVVAILGILSAIIVPNVAGFLTTSKTAAANVEVNNLETAALGYYADNDADWPDSSTLLVPDYLSGMPAQVYTFDSYGQAVPSEPDDWDGSGAISWDGEKWVRD